MAMRYWTPFTEEAARAVEAFAPDEVVLLPLYPQFSTTTTGSSLKAWREAYRGPGRVRAICCYPTATGVVSGHVNHIRAAYEAAGRPAPVRLLFSAHGLPEKVIAGGDPYQAQIEACAAAIAGELGAGWDWKVCYQSRVGPMKWLGPSTPEAIEEAARDGKGVVIAPIAFVSEHVETLVELDRDYGAMAADLGCSAYVRVPALGIEPAFISGLAQVVAEALGRDHGLEPASAWRCPSQHSACPWRKEIAA
jgi:ferrochelatase